LSAWATCTRWVDCCEAAGLETINIASSGSFARRSTCSNFRIFGWWACFDTDIGARVVNRATDIG
jgi:hypothetical protein